jgi:hypothetical protein
VLFSGTVPENKLLFSGRVSENNFFHVINDHHYDQMAISKTKMFSFGLSFTMSSNLQSDFSLEQYFEIGNNFLKLPTSITNLSSSMNVFFY